MPKYTGFANDVIMTFGDSITQYGLDMEISGWVTQLATHYTRKLDLVHRGFAGYNTNWAKTVFTQILPETNSELSENQISKTNLKHTNKRLPEVLNHELSDRRQARIRILTIFLGANDAAFPENKHHVPLEEYKSNLSEMINMIKDPRSKHYSKETKIILITPPAACQEMWDKAVLERGLPITRRSNERAKIYSDAAAEVGKRHGVAVVNLWEAFNSRIEEIKNTSSRDPTLGANSEFTQDRSLPSFAFDQLLRDGLHPNKAGNDLIAKKVMEAINIHYPELSPDNLEFTLPLWPDIVEYLERTEMQYNVRT